MPFLTEEVWQHIAERSPEDALIVSRWPEVKEVDSVLIADFEFASEVISGIRTIRKEKNIPQKDALELFVLNTEGIGKQMDAIILKLGNLSKMEVVDSSLDRALTFRVKSNEYFIPISGAIDVEAEIAKITEELNYTKGFLKSVEKKLGNERFVNNAPEQVVAMERKKAADAEAKIETLEKSLASLK